MHITTPLEEVFDLTIVPLLQYEWGGSAISHAVDEHYYLEYPAYTLYKCGCELPPQAQLENLVWLDKSKRIIYILNALPLCETQSVHFRLQFSCVV